MMSQSSPFRFDVDRFSCKNRSGYMDNMFRGNSSPEYNKANFKQLSEGKEFYETTLPYKKIVPDTNNPADMFFVFYNQTYISAKSNDAKTDIEGITQRVKLGDIENEKSIEGSGSNYLSNEIFYRVALLREKYRQEGNIPPKTGHFHISKLQDEGIKEDFSKSKNQTMLNIVKKSIEEGIKGI